MKREVIDLTVAASQTVNKLFHNALSGNYHFILIMLSKHMQASGVDMVSYAMTLANYNSGRLLRSLKAPASLKQVVLRQRVRMRVENNNFSTDYF